MVLVDPCKRRMDEIFSPGDRIRLHETVDVVWGRDDPMPLDEARDALRRVRAAVCSGWRYGDALKEASELRAILDVSGGFPQDLDYQWCFGHGIRVLSMAPAMGRQVAEMALGMALAASRNIVVGDRAMRAGHEQYLHAGNTDSFMLYGKRVGLIGFGGLARALLPLLAPFGCVISAYDPWLAPGYLRSQGVRPEGLNEILHTSQVIFVLAPPTSENNAMLDRAALQRIGPGAVLVLISRAHVVDFDTLTEHVLEGRYRAAIDVFPTEPLDPSHPIRSAEGAVLSAHRAGSVPDGMWDVGTMVVDDLEAIARGMPPQRMQIAQPELVQRYVAK
jgi:phosphoglycerate dehydrogenase-like enzyme